MEMDEPETHHTSYEDGPVKKKQRTSSGDESANTHTEVEETEGTQEYNLDETQEYNLDGTDESMETKIVNGSSAERIENVNGVKNDSENIVDKAAGTSTMKPHTFTKIESVQRDAMTISAIIPDTDVNDLYEKILKSRHEKNRIDIVTNNVLESMSSTAEGGSETVNDLNDQLFEDVAKIMKTKPEVDPSYVYGLLESCKDDSDRFDKVLAKVTKKSEDKTDAGSVKSSSSSLDNSSQPLAGDKSNPLNNSEFKKNPLYRDLKTLVKVLPAVSPNELYAYLEAHYGKPNRVQIVIDELTKSESQESLPLSREPSLEDLGKGKGPQSAEDKLQTELKELKDIFRDCDPNFLYEKLVMKVDDGERVHKIATELFETRDYPKLKDLMEANKKEEEKRKITEMNFDLKSFLLKFSDPLEYFNNLERTVNQNYKDHVSVYLKNTYPQLKAGYLKKILTEKRDHLLPAILEIETSLPLIRGNDSSEIQM